MRSLDLLLSPEEPHVDLPRAKDNGVSDPVEEDGGQSVLRPVADFIEDGLDTGVGESVPDSDAFVRGERDEVVLVIVQR